MIEIELIIVGLFGILMVIVGYYGISVYGRSFFQDPRATLSADMLLALLKGPSSVPVIMCLMLLIFGVMFIAMAALILGLMIITEAFNLWSDFWPW